MNFDSIRQPYNNCILPLLGVNDLGVLCKVSKNERKFALTEIFKRVCSGARQYQLRLFFYTVQQGRAHPNAIEIVRCFQNMCNRVPELKHLAHNSRVLAENLEGEKLQVLDNNDEMMLCCLVQNINNGIRLFNPLNKDAAPLCTQQSLQTFKSLSLTLTPNEIAFRSIAHNFWKASGNISIADQASFVGFLKELKITDENLKVLLAALITCLLSIDEKLLKTADQYIVRLVKQIFNTLAESAEHLPVPHILGLLSLILHHQDAKNDVFDSNMICKFIKFLPEESRSCFLEQLTDRIKKSDCTMTRHWLCSIYGDVAAQSESRYEILDSLINAWVNSDSKKFRTNVLSVIGTLVRGITAEKCIETVRIIHNHANAKDDLKGLYMLNDSLAKKMMKNGTQEQIDYLFEFFLNGLNDEQPANLSNQCVSSLESFRPLLTNSQKTRLLSRLILLLNKPNTLIHNLSWPINELVIDLTKSVGTSQIVAALPISCLDCFTLILKYRFFSPNEIENLYLPMKKSLESSHSLHDNMSYWIDLLRFSTPETARLITAKLLEHIPVRPMSWPYGHPIVSIKDFTEDQRAGILKAAVNCLQTEDYKIQNTGIWIIGELAKQGCNLSLYKDMLLIPLLGSILQKLPAFTTVNKEVMQLIGHLVPGLVGNDFDVVVKALMCLQNQKLFYSQHIIQTIGLLIGAIRRGNEEKIHLIDVLLIFVVKAIKDDDMTNPGEWVVNSGVLSFMSKAQLEQLVVQLHIMVKEDYKTYYLRSVLILAEISTINNEMNEFIRDLFGFELLRDMLQDYNSFEKACNLFGTLAFSGGSRAERHTNETALIAEFNNLSVSFKKRKT